MATHLDERQSLMDHDLLVRMDEKMESVLKQLNSYNAKQIELETRVRTLENFRFYLMGAAGAAGLVMGLVGSYIIHLTNH